MLRIQSSIVTSLMIIHIVVRIPYVDSLSMPIIMVAQFRCSIALFRVGFIIAIQSVHSLPAGRSLVIRLMFPGYPCFPCFPDQSTKPRSLSYTPCYSPVGRHGRNHDREGVVNLLKDVDEDRCWDEMPACRGPQSTAIHLTARENDT